MTAPALTFAPDTHEYRLGTTPLVSVTTFLRALGVVTVADAPEARLSFARDRGTAVHLCVQFQSEGRLDPTSVAPELAGYLFAFDQFCCAHHGDYVPERVEMPLCDPILGFAGTPDTAGPLQGIASVIDVKTCPPQPGHFVQLAAYRHLLNANGYPVSRRFLLQLKADGTFGLHEGRDRLDDAEFRAALLLYKRHHQRGDLA